MNLYQISQSLRQLSALELDGEGAEEAIALAVADLQEEFSVAANQILQLRAEQLAQETALSVEIERLEQLRDSVRKRSKKLLSFVHQQMKETGQRTLQLDHFQVSIVTGVERVVVPSVHDVPLDQDFLRTKVSVEPDKPAILKHLKALRAAGEALPSWAHLERGEDSIRVK